MNKHLLKILNFTCFLGMAMGLSSCTSLDAWERNNFAKAHMDSNPYPLMLSFREHTFASREGTQGGTEAMGGGCGCN